MIRDATIEDVPRIVEMGRHFYSAAAQPEIGEYNDDVIAAALTHLIENAPGILIVATENGIITGAIGGMVYPFFMSGRLTAQEFFWWSEGRQGRGLLKAFEEKANDMGAKTVQMICLEALSPDRLGKFYVRQGYRASERGFIKEL